ncbi:MAG: sialate O-acetylesterase [Planctomycetota bacterium]
MQSSTRPGVNNREFWAPSRLAVLCAVLGTAPTTAAELEIPAVFTDHMVIQRDQPMVFWGTCRPEQSVTVAFDSQKRSVSADENGRWRLVMPAYPAGGPYEIDIRTNEESIELRDVLVGDVWVCSGQSNMFWRLSETDRGDEFIQQASGPTLRLFQVEKEWDREPRDQVATRGWKACSPSEARRFSAVGYHFGRILNEELDVPVGLIQSAWGGTPLEAWTPMHVFEARPDTYGPRIESLIDYDLPDEEIERRLAEAHQRHIEFAEFVWASGSGLELGWQKPGFDDSNWPEMEMPGYIDGDLGSFDGIVWLRKSFELDSDSARRDAVLDLGRVDDFDQTFVNGVPVGSSDHSMGAGRLFREYEVGAGVLREGTNTVAIRLMDLRSSGGLVPRTGGPVIDFGEDDVIDLAGNWKFAVGIDARDHGGFPRPARYVVPAGRPFRRPAVLYNAMIHPLAPMGVKGVIWYQGESNSGRGSEYAEMFPEMINAWRRAWREARGEPEYRLPFFFVQLPNYRAARTDPHESSWAHLRDAQRTTLDRTEDTGMAITLDLGDPGDIHPTNKLPVAERLVRAAMSGVYRAPDDRYPGPLPKLAESTGDRVIVSWDHAQGLRTTDGRAPQAFELAGPDGEFYEARAALSDGRIIVSSDRVRQPTTIRYAWADNPQVNLVNSAGLPASTFELPVSPVGADRH